jgi:hypothetical protein
MDNLFHVALARWEEHRDKLIVHCTCSQHYVIQLEALASIDCNTDPERDFKQKQEYDIRVQIQTNNFEHMVEAKKSRIIQKTLEETCVYEIERRKNAKP